MPAGNPDAENKGFSAGAQTVLAKISIWLQAIFWLAIDSL
jgi:hypothetical protein